MKKLFSIPFILVLALIPMLSLSSCDSDDDDDNYKDLIVDYAPIEFDVACVNSQGEDLLDEKTTGCVIDESIKVQYEDQWYPLIDNPWADYESRAYYAIWHSPYIATVKDTDGVMKKVIRIGEIDGSTNGTTVVTLSIGNRMFKLKATNKIKKVTEVTRNYYLDGKKIDNDRGFYSIILK